MFAPVYLDHNATTALHPAVREAMLPFLEGQHGNASSRHEYGRAARRAVDEARQRVALAVGAHPTEVVFVSGGSEANNLFIKGAAGFRRSGRIAVSAIEHPCVREPARQLAKAGWTLEELPVDADGRLAGVDSWQPAMRPDLVSVMLANNETGVVQPVAELAARCSAGTWVHADAVQALGKLPVDFRELNRAGVHALSLSAHKIGGPQGAGALVVDKRVEIVPLIAGGGHERGLRSGTENVAAIVGFGMAAEVAVSGLEGGVRHLRGLRAQLEQGLLALGATLFGAAAERLPNTSYFAFAGVDGETLVGRLDRAGYAVASGAACSSANPEPSRVLTAMGVPVGLARGAVRVSLGGGNTAVQIAGFLHALEETLSGLRGMRALAGTA